GTDVGPDAGAATAEEAAVHLVYPRARPAGRPDGSTPRRRREEGGQGGEGGEGRETDREGAEAVTGVPVVLGPRGRSDDPTPSVGRDRGSADTRTRSGRGSRIVASPDAPGRGEYSYESPQFTGVGGARQRKGASGADGSRRTR
ncbi:DUF5709 domain-containing protein, partial [Kitasatospora sp. NPDC004272]